MRVALLNLEPCIVSSFANIWSRLVVRCEQLLACAYAGGTFLCIVMRRSSFRVSLPVRVLRFQ